MAWFLSTSSENFPAILQHGTRKEVGPGGGANFFGVQSKWLQYGGIAVLVVLQLFIRKYMQRWMKSSREAPPSSKSVVDLKAELARKLARSAATSNHVVANKEKVEEEDVNTSKDESKKKN